jgi:hypothetical protein
MTMTYVLRLATALALLGLTFVGAWILCPAVLADTGLDLWEWPEWQGALSAESERGERLDQDFEDMFSRRKARAWVGGELIAGRLTLPDATRRFFDLTAELEKVQNYAKVNFGGSTDGEARARYVIEFACELLRDEPARAQEVRQRLLAELRRL